MNGKRFRISALFAGVMALTALVAAQGSVNGTWSGEVQGRQGPQTLTLSLKADSGKLTGTITGGRGGDVMIEEGTIAGDALKFKTKQMGRGGEIIFNWTGTLKGDELAMTRLAEGGQGQKQEFTMKRK